SPTSLSSSIGMPTTTILGVTWSHPYTIPFLSLTNLLSISSNNF
ncbi:5649_t:CDS:1, partial [Gigaspora rosea]